MPPRSRRKTSQPAAPDQSPLKELAGDAPDLHRLKEEFDWAVNHRDANVWRRQKLNYETRYCLWGGQSWDGRRWTPDSEGNIWPWPGASDVRLMLTDKYVREDVAKLMVVWQRMQITVTGNEAQDLEWGGRLTNYLRWQLYRKMSEARFEAKLLANTLLERGAAVLGTFWTREQQLERMEIDLETVQAAAMQAERALQARQPLLNAELLIALPQLILDPSLEDQAVEAGQALGLDLPAPRLRQIGKDLRKQGTASFPRPYVKKNRPQLVAFALNEDLFLPPEATFDLQASPAIDRVELLTETQLRERVASQGWDEQWVTEVIETRRGAVSELHYNAHLRHFAQTLGLGGRQQGLVSLDPARLFEVVHAYRRRADADGIPVIEYTCYNPGLLEQAGYHAQLNYAHGEYPFHLALREVRSRRVDDARGLPECLHGMQAQMKAQWDGRIDRSDIATLPPFFHPPGLPPDRWGPGARFPTNRPEEYGYLATPKYDPGNEQVEESVRRFADEYAGRPVDEQNTVQSQALQQELADDWMAVWTSAGTQILQLCQQFENEQFYYKVVGSEKGRSIRATREEIQGEFDLLINFAVANLDNALVKEKIALVQGAIQLDDQQAIDRREALLVAFDMIDPSLGERLIRSGGDARAALRKQVLGDVMAMFQGNEPEYVSNDPGAGLKLQLLNAVVYGDGLEQTGNPKYQEALQRDARFAELMQNYVKNLQQSVVQLGQNIVTGRTGVKPVRAPAPRV